MSKMERKKTTWTVSPTRKKVIILILSVNAELGLQSRWRWRKEDLICLQVKGENKKRQNK